MIDILLLDRRQDISKYFVDLTVSTESHDTSHNTTIALQALNKPW